MVEIAILFFLVWLLMLVFLCIMYVVEFVKKLFKKKSSIMTEKQIEEGKKKL